MRKALVGLLRDINFRELSLQSLKKFVTSLDNIQDRRALERVKSTKSMMLYQMVKDLEESTKEIKGKVEAFLKEYRRYFGTCFCYQGTDYLTVIQREVDEIKETMRIIRNEDDEQMINLESRLFNGVLDLSPDLI